MIYIERTINITENNAYIEEPVVLYKGDSNIEIQFIINNNPFKYKAGLDLTYGQLIIKRPTTNPIFSNVAKLSSSKVLFVITGDMIDELVEIGNYDFQIRLLNADMSSRATLPPVSAGIVVKEPICEEGINTAPVNYSRAAINREIVDTFDEEGNYNKTDWSNGDIITDNKLNKIEDALYTINDNNSDYVTKDEIPTVPTDVSAFTNDAGYLTEHQDISHLATKAEVPTIPTNVSVFTNDAGYLTEHQSLEDYALKADIPSTDGLATEQYVNDAISNIEIPEGGNVDLSNYVTKSEFNSAGTISVFGAMSGMSWKYLNDTGDGIKVCKSTSMDPAIMIHTDSTGNNMSSITFAIDDVILIYSSTLNERPIKTVYNFTTSMKYVVGQYDSSYIELLEVKKQELFEDGGNELPIRVIGSDNPDEPYVLTGNEFTDEDYEIDTYHQVILKNVEIDGWSYPNDLCMINVYESNIGGEIVRCIDVYDQWGNQVYNIIDSDGNVVYDSDDWFVFNSQLKDFTINISTNIELTPDMWEIGELDYNGYTKLNAIRMIKPIYMTKNSIITFNKTDDDSLQYDVFHYKNEDCTLGGGSLYMKDSEYTVMQAGYYKISVTKTDTDTVDLQSLAEGAFTVHLLPNAAMRNYATKDYVDDAISNIEVSGGNIDLSNYATKDHTHNNYATQTALNTKVDLYMLNDYYTKEEIDATLGNIEDLLGGI